MCGITRKVEMAIYHVANWFPTLLPLQLKHDSNLWWVKSLVPWRWRCDFENAIFSLALLEIFNSSFDNTLRWLPWILPDDKSTLVQVVAWCPQATSHYLSQCWLRSLSPHGVTRLQWVEYKCNDRNIRKKHTKRTTGFRFKALLFSEYASFTGPLW